MLAFAKRSKLYQIILFYVMLIAIWQIYFYFTSLPHFAFPSPLQVGKRLVELGRDGLLSTSLRATILRIAIGYSIAALIGLSIGLLMGMNKILRNCFRSLALGLQTLPSAAWVPLSLLLFGLSDSGIYFVIIMSSFPTVAIATADGISRIPPLYLRVAQTLGTPKLMMPFRVIIPAALPMIVTGIKLGFTLAWHGGVSAELIKSSVGLGYLLSMGRELADAAQVVGIMIVTVVCGLVVDNFVFGVIEKRVAHRWGLLDRN